MWYQYRNESGKEGNSEDQQPKNILLGYVSIIKYNLRSGDGFFVHVNVY